MEMEMAAPRAAFDRREALTVSFGAFVALAVAGCSTTMPAQRVAKGLATHQDRNDPSSMYRAMPREKFPIRAVDLAKLDPKYHRQVVRYPTSEKSGTVIVDTASRYLYYVQDADTAVRYGVGIGKAGFAWSGRAHIAYKREWPVWTPPADMIKRQPELEEWRNGMPASIDNPLGARALYIHQGNVDTLYRIHGTAEVRTIGKAVSSGCIRLLHQDVIDLYERVRPGAPIVVRGIETA